MRQLNWIFLGVVVVATVPVCICLVKGIDGTVLATYFGFMGLALGINVKKYIDK